MSYIGSTPTTQSFIAGTDYFNGTGSQVAFTLSRSVNSVNDIEVIVNNVEQIPSGYSVSGTTLTFSAAPSAGTSNVYVRYLSTTNLSLAIPAGTSASFNTVTATSLTATDLTVTNGASIQGLTVGRGAGAAATNTAVGASALAANTTGSRSAAFGDNALLVNTTGERLVAIGSEALTANTTGSYNTAVGWRAAQTNTSGEYNTALGHTALTQNTTGSNNTSLGSQSLFSNTTASNNTAVGYQAGYTNTTGTYNLFMGYITGLSNTTGSQNTFVGGLGAGNAVTTGGKNTIIGNYSGNNGGLDIRTASNYIVLSDGDGNPRVYSAGGGGTNFIGETGNFCNSSYNKGTGSQLYTDFRVGWTSAASPGTQTGYISTNGTTTSYVTTSDYRLKEDIVPMTGALAKVALLKPVTYKWKVDGSAGQGFIAHELAEVEAGCVSGEKDAADAEGNPKYQGIDTSFLVATLTAAIQELKAEFDAYKEAHP